MTCETSNTATALSIWAAFASTVGIFITHVLTKAWERQRKYADNAKQEARELLTSLYKLFADFTPYATISSPLYGLHKDPKKVTELAERYTVATVEFHRMLNDRLYIARDIGPLDVKKRWDSASDKFWHHIGDEAELKAAVDGIRDDIVAMVLEKDLPIWTRWRRNGVRTKRKS
jgi:hypothetical protein